eukprot:COSAG06_NODE_66694_length_253_cov_2.019481_1_plen_41_part_01
MRSRTSSGPGSRDAPVAVRIKENATLFVVCFPSYVVVLSSL